VSLNISITINGEGKIEKMRPQLSGGVKVLLEGAEYGAETEDLTGSSDAAAAAGVRPPRLVD